MSTQPFNPRGASMAGALKVSGKGHEQSTPPDTGMGFGMEQENLSMAYRQRYAPPTSFGRADFTGSDEAGAPTYNTAEQYPVKYGYPNRQFEGVDIKNTLRAMAPAPSDGTGAQIVDTIGDDEVNYVRAVRAQSRVADIDKYVNALIDPRKPGQLKWLMEVYPQYVERRIAQVHTDYEFALRNQLIDMYGINTFDDLMFKYMVDQGEISGPLLANVVAPRDEYTAGFFAPSHWKKPVRGTKEGEDGRTKMPFNSARIGHRPAEGKSWELKDSGPLGEGNNLENIVGEMYGYKFNEDGRTSYQTNPRANNGREDNTTNVGDDPTFLNGGTSRFGRSTRR